MLSRLHATEVSEEDAQYRTTNGNERRPALNNIIPENPNQPYDIKK